MTDRTKKDKGNDYQGPFPSSAFPKTAFPRHIFPWMGEDDEDVNQEDERDEEDGAKDSADDN